MPVFLPDQIGLLRDFKFAKAADETIIIVEPAKRQSVDIVTSGAARRTAHFSCPTSNKLA